MSAKMVFTRQGLLLTCLFVFMFFVLIPPSHAEQSNAGFFYIKSAAHLDYYLSAAENGDGQLFLQKDRKNKDFAMWEFKKLDSAGAVHYTIKDKRHKKGLAMGERSDGHVYHQDNVNRAAARWNVVQVNGKTSFRLSDSANGGILASGETQDGKLYQQTNYDHIASEWIIEPAWEIKDFKDLPDFYTGQVEVEIIDLQVDMDKVDSKLQPPTLLYSASRTNNTSLKQKTTFEFAKTITTTETVTSSESLSVTAMNKIGASASLRIGNDDSMVSGVVSGGYRREFGNVRTSDHGKSFSREDTHQFKLVESITVSPHTEVTFKSEATMTTTSVPYKAKIKQTIKSIGVSEEKTITGYWSGVNRIYVKSGSEKEVPLE